MKVRFRVKITMEFDANLTYAQMGQIEEDDYCNPLQFIELPESIAKVDPDNIHILTIQPIELDSAYIYEDF